jgi:hypothetical protein
VIRGLLEKLIVSQLVNKFPTFYGTRWTTTARKTKEKMVGDRRPLGLIEEWNMMMKDTAGLHNQERISMLSENINS